MRPTAILDAGRNDTLLAGLGRAAVERARHGQEFAIHACLRAHADELRAAVTTLIAAKPDPALWTPTEHAIFIRATETPTGFDVRTNAPQPAPRQPATDTRTAEHQRIDSDIPF